MSILGRAGSMLEGEAFQSGARMLETALGHNEGRPSTWD